MNTRITPLWKTVIMILTVVGIFLAMNQAFFWDAFGVVILTNSYLYFILACFLPIVFLLFPASKVLKSKPMPIYDLVLATVTLVVCVYFGFKGESIVTNGWDKSLSYPTITLVFSCLLYTSPSPRDS